MTQIRDTAMGSYLKIVSRGGVYNNLKSNSELWDMILRQFKVDAVAGGEVKYNLRSTYGAAASQFVSNSSFGDFPAGQDSTLNEATAYYKEHSVAIDLPISVIKLAEKDFGRYGKPVAEEVEAKSIAHARMLSSSLAQDATGIIGTISSVTMSTSLDTASITLATGDTDRGFVGWFFEGDKVHVYHITSNAEVKATVNNTASATTGLDHWTVESIDRESNAIVLKPRNSAGTLIDVTATAAGQDPQAGDYLRRIGISFVDLSAIASTSDLGAYTEMWPGFEAWADVAGTGYKINGLNLSGTLDTSLKSCSGNLIDLSYIRQALTQVKTRVGANQYKGKWDSVWMSPETEDALADENESNRMVSSHKDGTRGFLGMGYAHRDEVFKYATDEFIRGKRIYVFPRSDVFQFIGGDFDYVRPEGGPIWQFKPSSTAGRISRRQIAFMEGAGLFFCVHPAAFLAIHNFTTA